jgi:superfamily I DNA/RNA helicase
MSTTRNTRRASCAALHQRAKGAGLRPAAVEAWDDWARKRVELYEAYEAQCQREGVVDFAELLLRCYELLKRNEPLAPALPGALPPRTGG